TGRLSQRLESRQRLYRPQRFMPQTRLGPALAASGRTARCMGMELLSPGTQRQIRKQRRRTGYHVLAYRRTPKSRSRLGAGYAGFAAGSRLRPGRTNGFGRTALRLSALVRCRRRRSTCAFRHNEGPDWTSLFHHPPAIAEWVANIPLIDTRSPERL